MKLAFAILCFCLAGVEGLQVAKPSVPKRAVSPVPEKTNCSDDTHWGIWIDGRDAHKGEASYGETYGQEVDPALKKMYAKAELNKKPDMALFKSVAHMVDEKFDEADGWHGLTPGSAVCLKEFPQKHFNEVMSDVSVMDKEFKYTHGASRGQQMTDMFKAYNKKQKKAVGDKEKQISAIAFLVHNMAFVHPLKDHNGRSRLLLVQHELRRLNLGCGTMMYNNNRDAIFNTPKETAGKIKEGMLMYNTWQESGVNPWTDPANQKKHLADFAVSKKLKKCWHEQGQTGAKAKNNHVGTSVE